MKKSTNTVDKEIGSRVRMRRMLVGMSQEKLGELLGLTFQQVQKYEKGTNRISVSRLLDIANVLGVGIDYFYGGLKGEKAAAGGFAEEPAPPFVSSFMSTPEGLQLMRSFTQIKNAKLRRSIVQLVNAMAADEAETERSS
jgi:transcriptional regulator with XRE-family HTH domain